MAKVLIGKNPHSQSFLASFDQQLISDKVVQVIGKYGFENIVYYPLIGGGNHHFQSAIMAFRSHPSRLLASQKDTLILLDCTTEAYKHENNGRNLQCFAEKCYINPDRIIVCSQQNYGASDIPLRDRGAFFDQLSYEYSLKAPLVSRIKIFKAECEDKYKKDYICLNNTLTVHRLMLVAYLLQNHLIRNSYLSFRPENARGGIGLRDICSKINRFPRIASLISGVDKLTPKELEYSIDSLTSEAPMKLATADESIPWQQFAMSRFSIVTETDFCNNPCGSRFTEKTLKPIMAGIPFIIIGAPHTLRALRHLGFATFSPVVDEAYDGKRNPERRLTLAFKSIRNLIRKLERDSSYLDRLNSLCTFNQDYLTSDLFRQRLEAEYLHSLDSVLYARFASRA